MKWIKRLWEKLCKWFRKGKLRKEYNSFQMVDSFPKGEEFKEDAIYFHEISKIVKFKCPCGCGFIESLQIEDKFDRKRQKWELHIENDKATLIDSIGSSAPCHSHYWIRNNKVVKC